MKVFHLLTLCDVQTLEEYPFTETRRYDVKIIPYKHFTRCRVCPYAARVGNMEARWPPNYIQQPSSELLVAMRGFGTEKVNFY